MPLEVKIHVQSQIAKSVVTFCRRLFSGGNTLSSYPELTKSKQDFDTVAILSYTLTKYYKIPKKIHKYSLYHALCTSLGLTDEVMVTILTVKHCTSKVLPSIHSEWTQW